MLPTVGSVAQAQASTRQSFSHKRLRFHLNSALKEKSQIRRRWELRFSLDGSVP